jgi:hypothetical protein
MDKKYTRVALPEKLVREVDSLVGGRRRSGFLTQVIQKELMRQRQVKALEAAAGAWKDEDHPELKQGADKWVEKLRRQDQRRFKAVASR